jgi:hypothetical protein
MKSALPLGNAPFTTVITGSMTSPKIPTGIGDSWTQTGPEYPVTTVTVAALGPKLPPYSGDSWRLAASVLGAAPLAVASAVSALSLLGTPSATVARPADASTARPFTTVIAASMVGPKIPEGIGDL